MCLEAGARWASRGVPSEFLWECQAARADNSDGPLVRQARRVGLGAKFFSHRTPGRIRDAGGVESGRRRSGWRALIVSRRWCSVLCVARSARRWAMPSCVRPASSSQRAWCPSWNCPGWRSSAASATGVGRSVCGSIPPMIPPRDRRRIRRNGRCRQTRSPSRRGAAFGYISSLERRTDLPHGPGLPVTAHQRRERYGAPSRHGARPRNRRARGDGNGNERSLGPRDTIPGQPRGASSPLRRSWLGLRWCPHSSRCGRREVIAERECRSRSDRIRGRSSRRAARVRVARLGPRIRRPRGRCRLPSLRRSKRGGTACWKPDGTAIRCRCSIGRCSPPVRPSVHVLSQRVRPCLTYAYALYDLGRAVRLTGESQAAVPILERRLQIDNQRWIVDAELHLGRRGIS